MRAEPAELLLVGHLVLQCAEISHDFLDGSSDQPLRVEPGGFADQLVTFAECERKTDSGFAVTKIALTTRAKVPGATKEQFDKAAADAKSGCPISKLFANNTTIELDATLA